MPANSYIATMVIPSYWGWTSYTPVIPKLYWDVYSQEERIKRLCREYDKLTHYASMIAESVNELANDMNVALDEMDAKIDALIESVNEQLEQQTQRVDEMLQQQQKNVDMQLDELKQYVDKRFDEISESQMLYDPTTGTYRPSKQSMRRVLQALSYDHKGNEQLVSFVAENNTVAQLATLTAYQTAYSTRSDIVIDDQLPEGN